MKIEKFLLSEMKMPELTSSEKDRFRLFIKMFNISEEEYQTYFKTLAAMLDKFESSNKKLYDICDLLSNTGPRYRDYNIIFIMGYFMAIFGQERINKFNEA